MIFRISFLVLAALDLRTLINVFSSHLLDFSQYYIYWANYFISGGNPFSAPLPQAYPPAFFFFIAPFAILPISVSRIIFTALSATSLIAGLLILFKRLSTKLKIILILLVLQLFPVKFTLGLGQINHFVFLGFVLIYYFLKNKREVWAGITLGLISIIKFSPILFSIYLLLTKKYKALLYCLGFFILINLTIDLFSPHPLNLSFLNVTLYKVNNPPLAYYNQSLPALLSRLNLSQLTLPLSALIFSLTSLFIFKTPKNNLQNFSLFLVTLLLISPITWQHYLVWTIPAFYYLFTQKLSLKYVFSFIAFLLVNSNIKNPEPFAANQFIFSHATFGLLLLYYLLVKKNKTK